MASLRPDHNSSKKSFLAQGWAKTKPAFFSLLSWIKNSSKYILGATLLIVALYLLNTLGYYITLYSIYTQFYDWLRSETNLRDQTIAMLSIWLSIAALYCGLLLLTFVFLPRWILRRIYSWSSLRYRLSILSAVGLFFSFFFAVSYWFTEPIEGENFNNKGEPRRRYIVCEFSPECPDGFHAVPLFKEHDRLSGQALEILTRENFQSLMQRKRKLEEEKSRKDLEAEKAQEKATREKKEKELEAKKIEEEAIRKQNTEERERNVLKLFDDTLLGENLKVRAESISVNSRFTDVFIALSRRDPSMGAKIYGDYSAKKIFLVDPAGNAYEAQGAVVLDPSPSSTRQIRQPENIRAGQSLRLKIWYKPIIEGQNFVSIRAGEYILATNIPVVHHKESAPIAQDENTRNDDPGEKKPLIRVVAYRREPPPEPPKAIINSLEYSPNPPANSPRFRAGILYKTSETGERIPLRFPMKNSWNAAITRGYIGLESISVYENWITLHIIIYFDDQTAPSYPWNGYFSNGAGVRYPSRHTPLNVTGDCLGCKRFAVTVDRLSVDNTSLYFHSTEGGTIDFSSPLREKLSRP